VSQFSFGKHKRLLNASDYKSVFDRADIKVSHKHVLLLARKNNLTYNRLGMVIAKKNIRLAVQRNRAKRIIRESFRCNTISQGLDIVVLARRGLDQIENAQFHTLITTQWLQLSRKLLRLNGNN